MRDRFGLIEWALRKQLERVTEQRVSDLNEPFARLCTDEETVQQVVLLTALFVTRQQGGVLPQPALDQLRATITPATSYRAAIEIIDDVLARSLQSVTYKQLDIDLARGWPARGDAWPGSDAPPNQETAGGTAARETASKKIESSGPSWPDNAAPSTYRVDDVKGKQAKTKGVVKESVRKAKRRAARLVNTGFAARSNAAEVLSADQPLRTGADYFFWLEVGARVRGSIEATDVELPTEHLPENTLLRVALFDFGVGLKIVPSQDVGALQLHTDGSISVAQQPLEVTPTSLSANARLLSRRLFFPVTTATEAGTFRLRCNIYYEQVLVQSRLITARVMRRPQRTPKALVAQADYTLSHTLAPGHVAGFRPHRLSVLLNNSPDGTHDFFFFGEQRDEQKYEKSNISFTGQELSDFIRQARSAYALAAWGSADPWQNQAYRYDQSRAQNQQLLTADLIRFAIRGYNFYSQIVARLAGGGGRRIQDLHNLLRQPGMIQIALKESPSFILPAAIIYDRALDVDAAYRQFTLCPAFLAALAAPTVLEQTPCFQGNCPTASDSLTIICPSGFWGYRHQLGLPLSVAEAADAPQQIVWRDKLELAVGVSTDPNFVLRTAHLMRLQQELPPGTDWRYADSREEVFRNLKETKPHVVYFYCHGGVSETRPYLQVGRPELNGNISPSNLLARNIFWDIPRPLVFINGCHTTALVPEKALEFVTAFIVNAAAAGVVGTEITIFEPLAGAFAEECLHRFLGGATLGASIRGARLKLLKNANPLGLVYIPYGMASLRLVRQNGNDS